MSKTILALALSVLALPGLSCTTAKTERNFPDSARPHVVFEHTSGEVKSWESLLNNVENLQKALGTTSIEVVVHGKALGLLVESENSAVRDRLEKIASDDVVFAACENTMRREKVDKSDLVPFAVTVDAGVAQVVRRQQAGWSYIRTDA